MHEIATLTNKYKTRTTNYSAGRKKMTVDVNGTDQTDNISENFYRKTPENSKVNVTIQTGRLSGHKYIDIDEKNTL